MMKVWTSLNSIQTNDGNRLQKEEYAIVYWAVGL